MALEKRYVLHILVYLTCWLACAYACVIFSGLQYYTADLYWYHGGDILGMLGMLATKNYAMAEF